MPTRPGACFTMVHSHFTFPFFQCGFNRPAQSTDASEFTPRTGSGRIAEIKLDLGLRFQCAPEDHPDPRAWQTISHPGGTQKGELRHQGPFATLLDSPAYPFRLWQVSNQFANFTRSWSIARHPRVDARMTQQTWPRWFNRGCLQPDSRVSGNFHQIPVAQGSDSIAKPRAFSIGFIRRDPAKWNHRALGQVGNHFQSQGRFGAKRLAFGNPTCSPTSLIGGR